MKILFHTTDKMEAESAKMLLAQRGVPVFIGNENSGPALAFILANKYTVWACLDEQYEDAKAALLDPDFEVKNPVDVGEYQAYIENAKPEINRYLFDRVMLAVVIGIVAVMGLSAWYALMHGEGPAQ